MAWRTAQEEGGAHRATRILFMECNKKYLEVYLGTTYIGGVVVIFGRGRTHMTRIPTGAQGFGKCYAHMLRTHTQPERAQITFFSTLSAIRLRGSDASIDAT